MREFETGATRDDEGDKLDYEGFLSPVVLECYARYMHEHRKQSDGELRSGDNWQKGIPKDAYMKSLIRHIFALWYTYRTDGCNGIPLEESLCAIIFNAQGLLFELLAEGRPDLRPSSS
jgi:hypothetical protein